MLGTTILDIQVFIFISPPRQCVLVKFIEAYISVSSRVTPGGCASLQSVQADSAVDAKILGVPKGLRIFLFQNIGTAAHQLRMIFH